ncbi:unnamed protein product [Timema podura]|uniref:Uncharacterized protein n=1 Tax=Timema podura TaxID=61482 RepID=A0ABN7P0M7_TIMPD|nr:unnamed protein product [Timema podura]
MKPRYGYWAITIDFLQEPYAPEVCKDLIKPLIGSLGTYDVRLLFYSLELMRLVVATDEGTHLLRELVKLVAVVFQDDRTNTSKYRQLLNDRTSQETFPENQRRAAKVLKRLVEMSPLVHEQLADVLPLHILERIMTDPIEAAHSTTLNLANKLRAAFRHVSGKSPTLEQPETSIAKDA